ncbi:MAG: hypothetical protein HKN74_14070 [Acidimicrobiia bacterium]|nr:hypothetical protein [Acidimicrobiia bacterium]MBT8217235.1 hypothetical protein [Acidimicrobiia bacterium]NNF11400.1 hypothetical protein [Acidimicrobiia bacterium]NNL70330.1 hypothetical protein [Acidimicrobiia bacterium]
MISLSLRRTLCDPTSEVDRVAGISIPDWDELPGIKFLRSVDYYEDAAFNYHSLGDVILEVDLWHEYELGRGDPEQRAEIIEQVRNSLAAALDRRGYAVFLSL